MSTERLWRQRKSLLAK